MHYAITKQLPPLAAPGTRTSQINRVFNAALGEFLDLHGGLRYEQLYARYMNIAPRFRPRSSDCDPWLAPEDADDALRTMLQRGVIRFGYVAGAPYVFRKDERLTGFDYELGETLAAIIGSHYHGHPERMRAEWVEVTLTGGEDQADKLSALYKGLTDGTFDLALSGQMMLPENFLRGLPIEWTAPTAILFTAITWTGRDRDRLDVRKLAALHSGNLPAFEEYAAEESARLGLELRIFSVNNPGPSPTSATGLVYAIHRQGGRGVWDTGDIPDSNAVMYEATDHFAVGDSLASGSQTMDRRFHGIYLNVPANDELWPIAGFTAGERDAAEPHFAIYAEHSDARKPMVLDPNVPRAQSGWNVRIFNRVEAQRGKSIRMLNGTGIVILQPGLYHLTGTSLVTYDDLAADRKVTTDAEPYGGYCRLRYATDVACDNERAIAIGTMSTANMLSSLFETYLEVKDAPAQILLEHQIGAGIAHVYLQGIWENSSWHVFARIAIRKV